MTRLAGKTALITGAARGIGLAFAGGLSFAGTHKSNCVNFESKLNSIEF